MNSITIQEDEREITLLQKLLIPVCFVRSLIYSILYLPTLILASTIAVICNIVFNSRAVDDWIIEMWGRGSCFFSGVNVRVIGSENIPKDSGCIFLFNHSSLYDVFAIQGFVKRGLRFGAKIELFKIPMFGMIMRRVGMLPIDRRNRSAVLRIYEMARDLIAKGNCYALAPEGTRSETNKLAPFKTGPFILGIEAQAPLVPVVVEGASEILPKGAFLPNATRWTTTIQLRILPPISTKNYTLERRYELQAIVRQEMLKYLPE